MNIKKLQVTNLRAIEQAEFEFMPGMNLLVGVNGVGKTTVLDSLRICLSKIIPDITASRSRKIPFVEEDIRVNSNFMTVNCTFELQDKDFTFGVHKNREIIVSSANYHEIVMETPDKESYNPPLPNSFHIVNKASSNPLGLFFSTRRSLVSDAIISKMKAAGGQASAYAEALVSRELRQAEIAHWMLTQEELGDERPLGLKHLLSLQKAAEHFMPECKNLRAETSPKPRLFVEKVGKYLFNWDEIPGNDSLRLTEYLKKNYRVDWIKTAKIEKIDDGKTIIVTDEKKTISLNLNKEETEVNLRIDDGNTDKFIVKKKNDKLNIYAETTLDFRQLSDGERGMFVLVLDLAKRLSQANPQLDYPVRDGSAIVLIDEIDLHLHPKWQRTIVKKLTETFPSCQFIATTHSPQIIASVEPEQVMLLTNSGVIQPERTRGMDSNWILRHLMEADDRPAESSSAISEVESLIKDGNFSDARVAITKYRKQGYDLPEWAVLETRMARLEVLAE